ncbi:PREDICTED: uncharacterized protein LOC106725033 isoform X2 [Myotis brandtii]|uniref:uncharacterized protein LOC106725033 isoform X2 n=1 Tax=Myotis brandtii TaxID=109478 RepID=UPI000703F26F|nr:PREDICTED: uncharacterized protein LOC106725033 isoform X2 [Myotis brandtii]
METRCGLGLPCPLPPGECPPQGHEAPSRGRRWTDVARALTVTHSELQPVPCISVAASIHPRGGRERSGDLGLPGLRGAAGRRGASGGSEEGTAGPGSSTEASRHIWKPPLLSTRLLLLGPVASGVETQPRGSRWEERGHWLGVRRHLERTRALKAQLMPG